MLARIRKEANARARADREAQGNAEAQTGNKAKVTAKPTLLLARDVSMDNLNMWISTCNDYYRVTKLEEEANHTQRTNLMSHFPKEMRGIVEHVLGIHPEETTKSCAEIVNEIKAHLRSNRNIYIYTD